MKHIVLLYSVIFVTWLIVMMLVLLTFSSCTDISNFHAVEGRVAECHVTKPNQIEAIDDRTGFPLLSTPHRYTCMLAKDGSYDWRVENESESSLESFSDVPSAIIQNAIPKAVVGY